MFNLNNADMENLFTQINKERLVDSNTALMMKELYYYALCEYWYDKLDRLHTDTKGRNTPMYMCECPTLAACIQWMIQTREYTFQTEQNGMVWHVVVKAGDYVLYDSESNADSFCCLEEALEKLDEDMAANATNSVKLGELLEEKKKVEQTLEEKMERWEHLEDLAAKIAAQ